MSAIDRYNHKVIGYIICPSTTDFVYNNSTRYIPVYELLENIPNDETSFDGKVGDILIGGGNGEAQALRISIPSALQFFTADTESFAKLEFDSYHDLFKAHWTPTQSYIYCEGFSKLGWTTNVEIEMWLVENLCNCLISTIKKYSSYRNDNFKELNNLEFILI